MEQFVAFSAAIVLVWKIVDFLKMLRGGDLNGALTQLFVWVAGVGVMFLLHHTAWAAGIELGGKSFASLDAASIVLFGMSIGSGASAVVDVKKSLDVHDTSRMPKLFGDLHVGDTTVAPTAAKSHKG